MSSSKVKFNDQVMMSSSPLAPFIGETPEATTTAKTTPATSSSFGKKATTPKFTLAIVPKPETEENENLIKNPDDIFLAVGPSSRSASAKLSPTADEFTPGLQATFDPTITENTQASGSMSEVSTEVQTPTGARNPAVGVIGQFATYGGPNYFPDQNPDNVPYPAASFAEAKQLHYINLVVKQGIFSDQDGHTRHFQISGIALNDQCADIIEIVHRFPSLLSVNVSQIASRGLCVVSFHNILEAERALMLCHNARPHWSFVFVSPQDVAGMGAGQPPSYVNPLEGQLLVTTFWDAGAPLFDGFMAIEAIRRRLNKVGSLKAMASIPSKQNGVKDFRVEFCDARDADMALWQLQDQRVGPFILQIEQYIGCLPQQPVVAPVATPALHREQLSITGRSTVPVDDSATMMAMVNLGNPVYGPIDTFNSRNGHNTVGITRIREGLDVRTTIMLRNIPNKVNQAMLKSILDETSFGDYDFMYLRIDFNNNCNVGYAFVNFVDPLAIIPFALARAGQRWNRFNSDKVAEISYATIQGRDCLIQKFRNSSVMLEDPAFRPKLYFTSDGPDAGREERFPGPDNPSKMRRSVENAETVGLFTPGERRAARAANRDQNEFYTRRPRLHVRSRDAGVPARALPPYPGPARDPMSLALLPPGYY